VEAFAAIPFDYRIFVFGLPFFMLAGQAAKLRRGHDHSATWSCLVQFGVGYGLAEWLVLLAPEPSGPLPLRLLRLAIMAPALFALLNFGRGQLRIFGRSLPGAWINLPLIALAFTGALQGLEQLDATCRYALGIPGGTLAGLALWRLARSRPGEQRLGLQIAALSLWGAVPMIGLATPITFLPSTTGTQTVPFLAAAQCHIQAILALCAIGVGSGLWIYQSGLESAADRKFQALISRGVTAIVLSVAVAFAAMDKCAYLYDSSMQRNLTDSAQTAFVQEEGGQTEFHTGWTWEQFVSNRRQIGLNFLKGTFLVIVCLVGAYHFWNIGWCVLRRKNQYICQTHISDRYMD